jgi:DNA-binding transcriptional ArsR family regulator
MAHPPPPPEPADPERTAQCLQAIADESRLLLLALLARRPHYGEELAEFLNLTPATISHHLRKLREASLVRAEKQSPYVLYRLDRERLAELLALLEPVSELHERLGLPSEEELSNHILRKLLDHEDRIKEIPSRRRQRAVLLRWLAKHFETGRIYPEREVHRVLLQFHDDSESLRKALLDMGWFQQAGGVYRRLEEVDHE